MLGAAPGAALLCPPRPAGPAAQLACQPRQPWPPRRRVSARPHACTRRLRSPEAAPAAGRPSRLRLTRTGRPARARPRPQLLGPRQRAGRPSPGAGALQGDRGPMRSAQWSGACGWVRAERAERPDAGVRGARSLLASYTARASSLSLLLVRRAIYAPSFLLAFLLLLEADCFCPAHTDVHPPATRDRLLWCAGLALLRCGTAAGTRLPRQAFAWHTAQQPRHLQALDTAPARPTATPRLPAHPPLAAQSHARCRSSHLPPAACASRRAPPR
jgi:hypothetical protein